MASYRMHVVFKSLPIFLSCLLLIMYMFLSFVQLLNQIVCELPPEHPVANVRPLRDSLGHTPLQV